MMIRRYILTACLSAVVTFIVMIIIMQPSNRVIETWKQPENIIYKDPWIYSISVVEGELSLSNFPFTVARKYFIFAGLDSKKPTYGHVVDYSFHPLSFDSMDNIEAYIKSCNVEWTEQGATFIEKSGHRIFIPKEMFIGTR